MTIIRCDTGAEFLRRAEAFLVTHEVENCLPLGIATQLCLYPETGKAAPYLGVVEENGQVIAAAVMTPPNRLVLATTESRSALALLAADVWSFAGSIPGASGPLPASQWFVDEWQALTGEAAALLMFERVYGLTEVIRPAGVPGKARRAGGSDRDLLIEWFDAFELEAFGNHNASTPERVDSFLEMSTRGVFVWEDPRPVSFAGFGGLTPHGARVGPVYTPPALRGHGYASALTAWLSQHLLDSGRQFCCLFTNQANPTSNHIYQTIGYSPVADVGDFKFTPAVP